MKKIIKSSVLFLGICFFAVRLNAQVSSDKPAMTAQQMTDLMQKRNADSKTATHVSTAPAVSSDKASMTAQQNTDLVEKRKAEAIKTASAATGTEKSATEASSSSKLPVVSDQGGVKPAVTAPAAENKVQQPVMPSEKTVVVPPSRQQ